MTRWGASSKSSWSRLSGLLLAVLVLPPHPARGQEQLLSLELLLRPFEAGLSSSAVLNSIRGRCLDFRPDDPEVQRRLRQAGADDAFLQELRGFCYRVEPAADTTAVADPTSDPPIPIRSYSPGSAMVRSFLVPGLGQFYTQRPALGAALLAGGVGALAAGLIVSHRTIECLARTDGACPAGQVRDTRTERPLALIGVAGFLAAGVYSGIDAAAAARRLNASAAASSASVGASAKESERRSVSVSPSVERMAGGGMRIRILHLRH